MKFCSKDVYRRKVKSQPITVKRTCRAQSMAAKKDNGPTPSCQPQFLEHFEGRATPGHQINKSLVPSPVKTSKNSVTFTGFSGAKKTDHDATNKPRYNYLGTANQAYKSWRISANKKLANQQSVNQDISKLHEIVQDTIFLRKKTNSYKKLITNYGRNLDEFLEKVINKEDNS
jgi:hypothetical protein